MKRRLVCMLLSMLTLLTYPILAWAFEVPAKPPKGVQIPVRYVRPAAPPAEETAPEAPVDVPAAPAEEPQAPEETYAGPANELAVYVDGAAVPAAHAVVKSGVTYVSARYVAQALCPGTACTWDGGSADMVCVGPGFSLTVRAGRSYLVCNERYLYIAGGVSTHPEDGELLVPVRVLAKALGAGVDWDDSGIRLTAGTPLEPGSSFYNAKDLDLLSRVVQHESGNQPLAGKIAVAQCILNRVKAGSRGGFADSVSGVIYQKGQFPGATNANPKSEAILAAKLAMDGADVVGSAKWFNGVGQPCWASRNKRLIANIGGHSFYG